MPTTAARTVRARFRALLPVWRIWVAGLVIAAATAGAWAAQGEERAAAPFGELFDAVWSAIAEQYAGVPVVDWNEAGARFRDAIAFAADQEGAYAAAQQMVSLLGDPGTFVRSPAEMQALSGDDPGSRFIGVGLLLGATPEGDVVVLSVLDRGPAQRAGVRRGERITAVDGVSTAGESVASVASRIRGERGTRVRLTLLSPQGSQRTLEIARAPVQFEARVSSRVLDGNIGYIALPSFGPGMDVDFLSSLRRMYRTRALIIDLRNSDGRVEPSVVLRIAGLLEEDPLGALVTRQGGFVIRPDRAWQGGTGRFGVPGPTQLDYYQKPLALLIDESAVSSLFALGFVHGLQESGRAKVVGRPARGGEMGVGYSVADLPGGGILRFATSFLVSLERRTFVNAVDPDLPVPMDGSFLEAWYAGGDRDIEVAREALLAEL